VSKTYALGRLEASGATVAFVRATFHEPFDIARRHVELVLEDSARPERRRLLVFRHADAFAAQVCRGVDATVLSHQDIRVEKLARGVDW
jgi:hypothetical protein